MHLLVLHLPSLVFFLFDALDSLLLSAFSTSPPNKSFFDIILEDVTDKV